MKRILSLMTMICMLFTCLPLNSLAEETQSQLSMYECTTKLTYFADGYITNAECCTSVSGVANVRLGEEELNSMYIIASYKDEECTKLVDIKSADFYEKNSTCYAKIDDLNTKDCEAIKEIFVNKQTLKPITEYKVTRINKVYITKIVDYDEAENLVDDCTVFVNGVEMSSGWLAFNEYVNSSSKVLIANSGASFGKYNRMYIKCEKWAVVDSIIGNKIYFDDFETGTGMAAHLNVAGIPVCTINKDGKEISISDLKENDVLLLSYDVTGNLNDSSFVAIDACDKAVTGILTTLRLDNDGKYICTVGDEDYKYVVDNGSYSLPFICGNTYTFYLDAKGRIVHYKEILLKNYGIIDRVYHDNNSGYDMVRIIKSDGTRDIDVLKDDEATYYAQMIAYGTQVYDGTLAAINDRVISYKINSRNEVHTISQIATTLVYGSYKADSTKVGSASMNDTTAIFDLTGTEPTYRYGAWYNDVTYTAADLKSGSLSTFVADEEYEVLYGDKDSDGIAGFVVIVDATATQPEEIIDTDDVYDDITYATVTSVKTDEQGNGIYTIGGKEYKYAKDNGSATFEPGDTYTFYIKDEQTILKYAVGNLVHNYGIIDRVYHDNNSGEDKVRIIKSDGTRDIYVLKDDTAAYDAQMIAYGTQIYDGTLAAINDRVIFYKINSRNEVHTISQIATTQVNNSYKAASASIGSVKMSNVTAIFDLTDISPLQHLDNKWYNDVSYMASNLKAGSLSTFVSGEEYEVLYGDEDSDGIAEVVVVVSGPPPITVQTHFAVVDSVGLSAVASIETCVFTMYTADSNEELVTLYADEEESCNYYDYGRGDVIVYSLTDKGRMENIQTIFKVNDNLVNGVFTLANANTISNISPIAGDTVAYASWYIKSGIASWDYSTAASTNGFARTGFGAIVGRSGNNITFAKIQQATEDITDGSNVIVEAGDYYSHDAAYYGGDICDFNVTSDTKVYVVDLSEKDKSNSNRLTVGGRGSIIKTSILSSLIYQNASGYDVYNWSELGSNGINPNYAYFKTVDGDITDILVILAKD